MQMTASRSSSHSSVTPSPRCATADVDAAEPTWLQKANFMCLMRNARIAALRSVFDPRTGVLSVRAPDGFIAVEPVLGPEGRMRMGAFLTAHLGEEARGQPRFHHVPGHVFGGQRRPAVSFINLASLAAYVAAIAPRDLMRFRANIYFTGPAWTEFDRIGREVLVGEIRLRATERTVRCPATEVNPRPPSAMPNRSRSYAPSAATPILGSTSK